METQIQGILNRGLMMEQQSRVLQGILIISQTEICFQMSQRIRNQLYDYNREILSMDSEPIERRYANLQHYDTILLEIERLQ